MTYCSECELIEPETRMMTGQELAENHMTEDENEEVCLCGAELTHFDEDRGRDR